ncbi:prepilin-type N-terminal cleavage/methylation domain-containing protein [Clostridium botulinum]|uniref:Prepilin-type N-terminal cleavage/methylation domain-containing protein n=1 Tax=Clostridium botulinum TaxID=1491 RepID=A0A6B4P2H3_CLOBO|nr:MULTISPECIES: prepilin-type N-terminal cleavage/methylation domain-containing protein [Clostridium]MBN1035896.1 prepilin-type N-terminal cleavage/methylation domain-containing protein [Clostridium botulinum]MBN1042584.1 prepilin-type N-terminal cleavage/methylation domain-containing protein [Clostridium botulinum]MBN1049106.1 prepilin-type N-terminal cleavage/methylation domain-containing protein [Clostridium botulinum]MBY6837381.1 prepilin-type N-terminal cleavage/methylation domain-contain
MKKKGFTLIELIASLSIIIIIFSLTLSVSDIHSTISNDIKSKSALYDVENLLSYSKAYCKKNKKNGEIQIDNIRNKILFGENAKKIVKQVDLTGKFKIINKNDCIQVRSNGHIKQGKTIVFQDNKNNIYKITIATGIDPINISGF